MCVERKNYMTGVESLFSEKSEMFSVSDAQTKPDKSMNDKEWDDYLNKIDNVLDFYKQITVEDGKKNLETADKEREENRAVWLEDISKLMQMGQTFVAEKINNENIQEKQKEQELLKNNKNEYFALRDGADIIYKGVCFVCNEEDNSISLGDMSDPSKVITIPLSGGGTLKVNRVVSNLGCPETTIIGTLSTHAPCTPFIAFVPPGPLVTQTAAIFPDKRAYPSAAIEHACS